MKKSNNWLKVVLANPSMGSKTSTTRWLRAYDHIFGEGSSFIGRDVVTSDIEILELSEDGSQSEDLNIRRANRMFSNIREDDDGNPILSYFDRRRDDIDEERREMELNAEEMRKKKRFKA